MDITITIESKGKTYEWYGDNLFDAMGFIKAIHSTGNGHGDMQLSFAAHAVMDNKTGQMLKEMTSTL